MWHIMSTQAAAEGATSFVASSGGNAGLAAVFASRELGLPITVLVPETTSSVLKEKLMKEGAEVVVSGKVWDETDIEARRLANKPGCQYVHPFDNRVIWEGHSSLVKEMHQQLCGVVPSAVVVSVGGGGLLCGVLQGLEEVGWGAVPVVAMETVGADSLNACANTGLWVELPAITSVAKCLGARKVCRQAFESLQKDPVLSNVVSDEEALKACVAFADDHDVFIPPACGVALAAVYSGVLKRLQEEKKLPQTLSCVVVVVCGGSGVDANKIEEWRKTTTS